MPNPSEDASVRHQIYVERLAASNANKLDPELKGLAAYVRQKLAAEGGRIESKKAMTALVSDIRKRFLSTYRKWENDTNAFLIDLAAYETGFQTGIIDAETVDSYTAKKPKDGKTEANAKNTPLMIGANGGAVSQKALVGNFPDNETRKATSLIESGFYQGLKTPEIIASIVGTKANKYKDGILSGTKRNATKISKTSAEHITSSASDTVYVENGDAVRGYILTAVIDSKTSKTCRGLDGTEVAKTDDWQPKPPFHFNCRTVMRPWLREDLEKAKLAARETKGATVDKYESTKKQYYTWLKTQPAWFQDDVLGVTEGKIFRNAGLTPQEFKAATIKRDGTPLNLSEMAQKDERILSYLEKAN